MKRYIRLSRDAEVPVIDIVIYADHPLLHEDVTSSVDISKYGLPNRPVISKDKEMIEGWMIDDFESFMENVEILCEEDYGLIGTYKNVSKDNSYYYNYLAKDDNGRIIAKFRLRLRISNHSPKRGSGQNKLKKEELKSPELQKLLSEQEIKKLTTYAKVITINNEVYSSYELAFRAVHEIIDHSVSVMKKGRS